MGNGWKKEQPSAIEMLPIPSVRMLVQKVEKEKNGMITVYYDLLIQQQSIQMTEAEWNAFHAVHPT